MRSDAELARAQVLELRRQTKAAGRRTPAQEVEFAMQQALKKKPTAVHADLLHAAHEAVIIAIAHGAGGARSTNPNERGAARWGAGLARAQRILRAEIAAHSGRAGERTGSALRRVHDAFLATDPSEAARRRLEGAADPGFWNDPTVGATLEGAAKELLAMAEADDLGGAADTAVSPLEYALDLLDEELVYFLGNKKEL